VNELPVARAVLEVLIFWMLTAPHEFAHAWVATRLGDDTPRLQGRVTLNPLAHVDWIGTVFLPFVSVISGAGFLGWGKPVMTNPMNFKGWRRDILLVALAGPGSNIILAVIAALLAALLPRDMAEIAAYACFLSLYLAFFNLVPVPPLDGSRIWLLSPSLQPVYETLGRFGFLGIMLLFYMTNLGGWLSNASLMGSSLLLRMFRWG
jgi:Zn-dependent protease